MRDVDDLGGDGAIGAGRGREDDGLAAGDLGGHAEHEGRGGEDGGAAGDVEADALDGAGEAGAEYAGHGLDSQGVGLALGGVETTDVFVAGVDGGGGGGGELHEVWGEGSAQDGRGEAGGLFELVRVGEQGGVAFGADARDYGLDDCHDGFGGALGGALESGFDGGGGG